MPDGIRKIAPIRVRRESFRPTAQPPASVQLAFWMLLGPLLLRAAYQVGTLHVTELFHKFELGYTAREPGTQMPVAVGIVFVALWVIFLAAVSVFWFWVTLLLRRGIGWARVLTTLSVASGPIALIAQFDVLALLQSLVEIAAIVLLWSRSARDFFAGATIERRQKRALQLN